MFCLIKLPPKSNLHLKPLQPLKEEETYEAVSAKLTQFVEDIFTYADIAELESECAEPCQQMKFQILKRRDRHSKYPYFWVQVLKQYTSV